MVGSYLRRAGIDDAILWVYHPGYGEFVDLIPHKLLIYDCVDNYPSFPEFREHSDWLAKREEALCRQADLVTCTAPALLEQKKGFNPGNTFLVHNVGDAEHFARASDDATEVAVELQDIRRPIIGFVGAVSDYKLNIDWLVALAEARPDVDVVVIGPIGNADASTDVRRLIKAPNIQLLGHRAYADLPRYLKAFDVAVIPYRINEHTESVFPIKFFEFLATGRPVVISNLPALEQFYDTVHVATTSDEFVQLCGHALQAEDDQVERRVALAHANSWPARIGRIMELVEERLPGAAQS
jgi:glycosyltransferase involved in cell wall biosynthesis